MHDSTKILVVDDTPANLEVITETLSSAGYVIATAISGDRALKRLQNYLPDLILLDVQMPGIDGFETCRQIKANPETANIPIIFITALSDTESIVKGFSLGAVDYISKPFQEPELLARVKTHLQLQFFNQSLEKQVVERTTELQTTLEELHQSHLQMVQNEKMATLGNLVAGVAHEVNNPIGFIRGSISNASEYIQDLFAHIECYQEHYPTTKDAVIQHAEDIELEYIREDLPKLLSSIEFAIQRIIDISNSLRTFSRADTSTKVACNIHEGIDSTILILKYRLKANDKRPAIQIIKDYGELPLVKCFLGQLNQVFMNIIANAIDVLDTTNEGKEFSELKLNPQKITITTKAEIEKNTVLISIKDNGQGMTESVRERIFDNLFTTKGVGKGTGLGLAIAKKIIEETHSGKLSCNSKLGQGTEFVIELPNSC